MVVVRERGHGRGGRRHGLVDRSPGKRRQAKFAVGMSREPCFSFSSPMHGFCGVAEINEAELRQSRAERAEACTGLSLRLLRRMSRWLE